MARTLTAAEGRPELDLQMGGAEAALAALAAKLMVDTQVWGMGGG